MRDGVCACVGTCVCVCVGLYVSVHVRACTGVRAERLRGRARFQRGLDALRFLGVTYLVETKTDVSARLLKNLLLAPRPPGFRSRNHFPPEIV